MVPSDADEKTMESIALADEKIKAQLEGSGDREISTTMALVRIITVMLRDSNVSRHIVPIVPDEARTFGMEALFRQAGVPAGPINTVADVFAEPQIQSRGMQVNVPHPLNSDLQLVGNPIKLSRTPVAYRSAPPMLGEHTDAVLGNHGDS